MMGGMMLESRVMTTVSRRLMVVSAKGGVGKSTVTVNLAAALLARGRRVGIFDADVHGPNIPALLGVRRRAKITNHPENMMTIQARSDSAALTRPVRPFERYGLQIASLALRVGEMQTIQPQEGTIGTLTTFMLRQLDWNGADLLLFDMPPGTGEPLDTLIRDVRIDGALIVTTREQLAHMDNGRILSQLKREGVPVLGVVENMTHVICPNCGELVPLYPLPVEAMAEVYGQTPLLASLPFDPTLIRSPGGGAPLPLRHPSHPVAVALLELADKVIECLDRVSPQ
jgi:ATP-binding protein involved in chromosome partitioning